MMNKFCKVLIFLIFSNQIFAKAQKNIDLAKLHASGKLEIVNRKVNASIQNGTVFLKVIENGGEGLIWLPVNNFENGTITIQMRGKDVPQRSFIGVAFHGQDNKTYEAVYCRPFNFLSVDSAKRSHAIQYISHPTYTWEKLREEQNGIFEKEISEPPNPNDWFTMTVVIDQNKVKAYINGSKTPALVVKKLNDKQDGKIGIFMGDRSGGDFKLITVSK